MPSGMVQIHRIVSRPAATFATIVPMASAMTICTGTTASVRRNVFCTRARKIEIAHHTLDIGKRGRAIVGDGKPDRLHKRHDEEQRQERHRGQDQQIGDPGAVVRHWL